MPEVPREFTVKTTPQSTHYILADDYYVVSGAGAGRGDPNVEFYLEEEELAVCRRPRGETTLASPTTAIGPVYRIGETGPLAVPTGKVFVRFAEHATFEDHRKEIEEAGFEISQILPYAPHASWVEPSSRKIADAISGFNALQQIPGVEIVEPQMLMERRHSI